MHTKLTGMKKQIIFFFSLVFSVLFGAAQKGDLMVKTSEKGLYLEHKVEAKQSFFSVGRLYFIHPKNLADFNKLDLNKGLLIDQKLRIPLTDSNFAQDKMSGTPVYYKVGDKEGLMTVSNKHNKVSLANLRSWNSLSDDKVKEDTKLIVGFLTRPDAGSIAAIHNPVKKEEEKPIVKKEEEPVVKKEEKITEKPEEKPMVKAEENPVSKEYGYFKNHFEKQIKINPTSKTETVTSGIFKTSSGWQDTKYYLLIDKVSSGTIVKVINPTNNKTIYAKVLGEMSGIRQNAGLNIRISNAAASVLEITEPDKFIVKVSY